MTKTYCVHGYMDWVLDVKTDAEDEKHKFERFEFTGGQITGYGVAPATFTTDQPYFQRLIESTPQFKSGLIRLLRNRHEVDDR